MNGATVDFIDTNFPPLQCPEDEGNAIFCSGFSQNVADMVIHSPLTNLKIVSNILIGHTRSHKF
jgi:hypothetical protein